MTLITEDTPIFFYPVVSLFLIILILIKYIFIAIVNSNLNLFLSPQTLDMNAVRVVSEANGNCKSSINEKGSNFQRNIDISISCGKTIIITKTNYYEVLLGFYYNSKMILK